MTGTLLRVRNLSAVLTVGILQACFGGGSRITAIATAKQIEAASELIGGPNATGRVGDFLLQNERIRVIIQNADVPAAVPFSNGGNLIDADRVRFPGEQGGDRFDGATLLLNGVRTVKAKHVFVLEDGSASGYAVVRAEGDDAPYKGLTLTQFANSVSVSAGAFDRDASLDILVKTDYILRPGANYVEVRTTFINRRSAATSVVVGDIIGNGTTQPFVSAGAGFHLPSSAEQWSAPLSTLILESVGVSYGYYFGREQVIEAADKRSRSAFVSSGVLIPFANRLGMFFKVGSLAEAVNPEASDSKNRLVIPGAGSSSVSRFLIVGQGDAGQIFEGINSIRARNSEFVTGNVTTLSESSDVVPAAGADVAVLSGGLPVAHFKADANGQYRGALPPGDYQLAVNMAGHPYKDVAGEPELIPVTVGRKENRTQSVDFSVPAAALLRIFVKDMSARETKDGQPADPIEPLETPLAGHVMVQRDGGDPSPDEALIQDHAVFPFRPAQGNVITVSLSGEKSLEVEPGNYSIQGYHGPDYSVSKTTVSLKAGKRADRVLELARVVPAHVNLPLEFSEVNSGNKGSFSPSDRIVQALAEGIQLLIGTDIGGRADMAAALVDLNQEFGTAESPTPASKKIGVATGERVTTSGYGSFSAWPLVPDPTLPNGGALAWEGSGSGPALAPGDIVTALMALNADEPPVVVLDYPYAPTGSADLGYLDQLDLQVDWKTGTVAPGPNGVSPIVAGLGNIDTKSLWTDKWQFFNVMSSNNPGVIDLSLNAWFAMLNVSLRPNEDNAVPQVVAVGSQIGSDQTVSLHGGPRNLVGLPGDSLDRFNTDNAANMKEVDDFLRAAENVVTNGPSVSLRVTNGGLKSAGPGELLSLFPATTAVFQVDVTTPCWMKVDRIDIYSNSKIDTPHIVNNSISVAPVTAATFTSLVETIKNGRSGQPDAAACRADGSGFGRIEMSVQGSLPLSRDAWVVAVVRGGGPMPNGVKPVAITNPVFIDFGSNSEFDKLCPGTACPNGTGKTKLGWYTPEKAADFFQ